jgi:hypothetical protein
MITVNGVSTTVNLTGSYTFTGPYKVNTDCTVTKTITLTGTGNGNGVATNWFITAGDQFDELRFICTDPGAIISGTARMQQP